MKRISLMTMMAAAIIFMTSLTANAQGDVKKKEPTAKTEKHAAKPKKKVKLKAKTIDKSKGTGMNIKQEKPTSDIMSAGSDCSYTCTATVNNYSYYTVDLYLDGIYAGTVSPKSYLKVSTCNGYTTFYGVSVGKTKEWSSTGDCNFAVNWNLYGD